MTTFRKVRWFHCTSLLALTLWISVAGCKPQQRTPQNGIIEKTNDDGSIDTMRYERGRPIYQSVHSKTGMKTLERFAYYYSSSPQKNSSQQIPDRDSTVQYGPKGQIVSIYTTHRSTDGSDWVVAMKSYHEDGSPAVIMDSTGTRIYYPSGRLQFIKIPIGRNAERQTYFDTLGVKREEWETLNNIRHGKLHVYNAQGKLTRHEVYNNGKKIR